MPVPVRDPEPPTSEIKPELENADPLDSRQFLLAVKRLADSLSYGTDHSPFLGQGIEYVQSRHYQAGDPIKSMDWRVTARTGKYHVKEFETPKRLPVWFVVDTSSSMTLSSTTLSKYNLAVQIAGGLALACLERMSPVGVLGAGHRDLTIRPSLSRDVLLQWLHQLRHFRYDEHTSLGARLTALEPSLRQRTLLIVLSDLHDPKSIPALKVIGARHDCVVIQLRDPAEETLEGAGHFRAREVETHRHFTTSGHRQLSSSDGIEAALKKAALDHFLLHTDKPFLAALRLFLQSRHLLSR
jgi:uncharacterized protein (DUF58 family)